MNYFSPINSQFFDANGNPLNAGKVYTYLAGTSTPATTYTTQGGTTPQSNPIILDSLGYMPNPLWLATGVSYKLIIQDSSGTTLKTFDNIGGVNDVSTPLSQWVTFTGTATYISATQFSVTGDQTAIFSTGRRLQTTNSGGTIYSTITTGVYSAGITTVTIVSDAGGLDSGLSTVLYGVLTYVNSAMPKAQSSASADNISGGAANQLVYQTAPGTTAKLTAGTTGQYLQQGASAPQWISLTNPPAVRQTVLSGNVDSNGLPSFGGSTGSTTVTSTSTLIATAANGFTVAGQTDYVGSIANPSWTGLSTNGTMYLYLDIAANGTCTPGSTTLAPVYQWGGTYSTTNNQFTFNIQEMIGKVGNGSTAAQTYRVFVGEVTVSGGVVTVITWYALQGRYAGAWTATLPAGSTATTVSHNIGVDIVQPPEMVAECTTADVGYTVGQKLTVRSTQNGASVSALCIPYDRKLATIVNGGTGFIAFNPSTFGAVVLTAANWKYRVSANRGW